MQVYGFGFGVCGFGCEVCGCEAVCGCESGDGSAGSGGAAGSGTVADLIPHFDGTLSGAGADVSIATTTTGSTPLSGTFRLTYDDTGANPKQTDLIRSDAPAASVKAALELLPNVGRISVTRLVDTDGFTWKVTFNGCKTIGLESERNICNYGNIRQLVGDSSGRILLSIILCLYYFMSLLQIIANTLITKNTRTIVLVF